MMQRLFILRIGKSILRNVSSTRFTCTSLHKNRAEGSRDVPATSVCLLFVHLFIYGKQKRDYSCYCECTSFKNREPLQRRFHKQSMVELLTIRAKILHFGSVSLLVIQAHQQFILKIFIRSSSDFVMCVHTSALPESPKLILVAKSKTPP